MFTFQTLHERLATSHATEVSLSDEERDQLDLELAELMQSIASEPTADRAEAQLLQLGAFQSALATICFKHEQRLSERQRRLVSLYDRWDDAGERHWFYGLITSGEF